MDIVVAFFSDLGAFLATANAEITPYLPLVAVVGGIIAAVATIRSLKHAADSTVTNAFLDLRAKYHTDDMRNAIELLVGFALPVKEGVSDQWNNKLKVGDFGAIGTLLRGELERMPVDGKSRILVAVRKVSSFFDDVGFLCKHRIIDDEDVVRSFINVPGINIYYEVCAPIHAARNPQSPSIKHARRLRKIVKQYGRGMEKY